MLLNLNHRTTFLYEGQARDSVNEVRLRPVDNDLQTCRHFSLRIDPDSSLRDYVDFHGNIVHYFDISAKHSKLVIEAESEVETLPNAERSPVPAVGYPNGASSEWEMQAEFCTDSHYVPLAPEIWREAKDALAGGQSDIWTDVCLMGRHVFKTFAFKSHVTGVSTRATDALSIRAGVCQDFAHVLLGMCRCTGIPARYVSGYFLNRHRRPGEIEASHAWVEAFVPSFGWVGFDPTHDRPADERYIKVAVGRDYSDIRPVSGTYRGAPTRDLRVEVVVTEAAVFAAR